MIRFSIETATRVCWLVLGIREQRCWRDCWRVTMLREQIWRFVWRDGRQRAAANRVPRRGRIDHVGDCLRLLLLLIYHVSDSLCDGPARVEQLVEGCRIGESRMLLLLVKIGLRLVEIQHG